MFSTPEFLAWSRSKVVLFASIETGLADREDDSLLQRFELHGFPSLLVLDESGEVLCRGIEPTAVAIRTAVFAATDYRDLAPQVQAGDDVDPGVWFMARLGTNRLSWDEAKLAMVGLTLTDAQTADAASQLLALELDDLRLKLSSKALSKDLVADRVYAIHSSGIAPAEGSMLLPFFHSMLATGAVRAKDAAAFGVAYPKIKQRLEDQVSMLEQSKKPHSEFVTKMIDDTERSLAKLDKLAASVESGFDLKD